MDFDAALLLITRHHWRLNDLLTFGIQGILKAQKNCETHFKNSVMINCSPFSSKAIKSYLCWRHEMFIHLCILFHFPHVLPASNSICYCNKLLCLQHNWLGRRETFVLIRQSSLRQQSAFNLIKFFLVWCYLSSERGWQFIAQHINKKQRHGNISKEKNEAIRWTVLEWVNNIFEASCSLFCLQLVLWSQAFLRCFTIAHKKHLSILTIFILPNMDYTNFHFEALPTQFIINRCSTHRKSLNSIDEISDEKGSGWLFFILECS